MKKLFLIFAMMLSFAIVSLGQNKNALKDVISQVNQTCPVSMGTIGNLTKVDYDLSKNQVAFYMQIESQLVNSQALGKVSETVKKTIMGAWASSEGSRTLMKMISKNEGSLLIVMNTADGDKYEIDFTHDEIASIADGRIESISPREYFENNVKTTNAQCPLVIDPVTTLSSVELSGDYFIYNYTISPESGIGVSDLNLEFLKNNISQSFSSDDLAINQMIGWCKDGNIGIIYRYWIGAQKLDIVFTPEEIKEFKGDRVR